MSRRRTEELQRDRAHRGRSASSARSVSRPRPTSRRLERKLNAAREEAAKRAEEGEEVAQAPTAKAPRRPRRRRRADGASCAGASTPSSSGAGSRRVGPRAVEAVDRRAACSSAAHRPRARRARSRRDEPIARRRARRRSSCRAAAASSRPRSTRSASTCTVAGASTSAPSTGGFTDCLLQRGAAHVSRSTSAAASSRGRLRNDARVTVMERTNVRDARAGRARAAADVCVVDVSFISLRTVAPHLLDAHDRAADFVLLVKPQFEAGRARRRQGRHRARSRRAGDGRRRGRRRARRAPGSACTTLVASPITGADGNVEYLAHARRGDRASIDRATRRSRRARRAVNARHAAVGLVPHRDRAARAHARAGCRGLVRRARRRGARAARPKPTPPGSRTSGASADEVRRRASTSCIALGGDGTMLHTVQLVYPEPVPILGVNVGPARLPHRARARRARAGAAAPARRRLLGLGAHDARGRVTTAGGDAAASSR